MFGWLAQKAENARVHMCTKELLWDLETFDGTARAQVRIYTALWAAHFTTLGADLAVVHDPLASPRWALLNVYSSMEELRNQGRTQHDLMNRNRKRLGMPIPPKAEDDSFLMMRAMEMLMISIGAGIVPDRRDDVLAAWRMLASVSEADVEVAIKRFMTLEEMGHVMGDGSAAWGEPLTPELCRELATFLPDFARQTLYATA